MAARFRTVDSSFQFFRTFVPFFYSRLNANRSITGQFGALTQAEGWCVGDAHPENFGSLLDDDGRAYFAMNDTDDSGPCPLYADLLRFWVSTQLVQSDGEEPDLYRAYLKGLDGHAERPPKAIANMMRESERRGLEIPGRFLKKGKKQRELRRGPDLIAVKASTAVKIKSEIRAAFPGAKTFDMAERLRLYGGSGGLKRYLVLLKLTDGGRPNRVLLELKEMVLPGIFPVARENIPDEALRLQKSLLFNHEGRASHFQLVMTIDGTPFMARPRWRGQLGVQLQRLRPSEISEILVYEAHLLGRVHRLTAADLSSYRRMLDDLPAQVLARVAREMKEELIVAFENFRDNP